MQSIASMESDQTSKLIKVNQLANCLTVTNVLILLLAYPDVIAVVGSDVSLPCNVSRIRSDNVTLILWYRSDDMISGPPIYSVDARSTSSLDLSKAIHFTPESMSSKAKFDLTVRPAMLRIKDVNPQDDGQYWCRVDYRWTRTTISLIKLNVIGM